MNKRISYGSNANIIIAIGAVFCMSLSTTLYAAEDEKIIAETLTSDGEVISNTVEPIEEVVVTGSRMGIDATRLAAQSITIDEDDIRLSGQPTLERMLRELPQNQFGASDLGGVVSDSEGLGYNISGMSTVNLRGIGNDSTLILVNGKRIGRQGSTGVATDISRIPKDAIQRIDVILDGASAIYGSDAVGGVVNIILKDDYDELSISYSYGTPEDGGYNEQQIGLRGGLSWDTGNIIAAYDRFDTDALLVGDTGFFENEDVPFQGGLTQLRILSSGEDFLVPEGWSGDVNDLIPFTGPSTNKTQALIPEKTRDSYRIDLSQELGASIEMNLGISYTETDSLNPGNADGVLDATSFGRFMNGAQPNNALGENVRVFGIQFPDYPTWSATETDTTNIMLSFDGDIGSSSWNWELSGGNNENNMDSVQSNALIPGAAGSALGFSGWDHDGDAVTDPLRLDPFFNGTPDVVAQMMWDPISNSQNKQDYVEGLLRGELVQMPGGAVAAVLGFMNIKDSLQTFSEIGLGVTGVTGTSSAVDNSVSRKGKAVFAEFGFPLVSADNRKTLLEQLDVNLAVRNDDYDSAAGEETTWQAGMVWAPSADWRIRFNTGTSFVAPTLAQGLLGTNYSYRPNGAFIYLPGTNTFSGEFADTYTLSGGNLNLRPETATTTSYGIQFTPAAVEGLTVKLDFYDIDYTDRIIRHNLGLWTRLIDRLSEMERGRTNIPAFSGPLHPDTTNLFGGAVPSDFDGYIWDQRWKNAGSVKTDGVDTQIEYILATDSKGEFGFRLNYSHVGSYDVIDETGAETSWLGESIAGIDVISKDSYNANVSWYRRGLSVAVNASKRSDTSQQLTDIRDRNIKPPTNVNLNVNYDFSEADTSGGSGFLDGVMVNFSVTNLTDDDAKITYTEAGVTTVENKLFPSLTEARGRFYTLQLRKSF